MTVLEDKKVHEARSVLATLESLLLGSAWTRGIISGAQALLKSAANCP